MPRESDVSDDAASKDKSRVTRSLRKRLNSTDFEDSPIMLSQSTSKQSSASRNKLISISEKDSDLDLDNSSSTIAPNDKNGTSDELPVRKTRARASSALTEENVTALNNTPSRRTTRRNSGANELSIISASALPLPGTPSRRSTRRTSVTSDDTASVVSSTIATRKTPGRKSLAAPPATVPEEPESDEISPTPRKTPNRSRRSLTISSPSASEQDEKDPKIPSKKTIEVEPHPVEIHRSFDTPTKRLSVRLLRNENLSRSIIEINDESASQSIVQIDDTLENSPSELPLKSQYVQTAKDNTIDLVVDEVSVKEELVEESPTDISVPTNDDTEQNISQKSIKLNDSKTIKVDNNESNSSSVFLETSDILPTDSIVINKSKLNDSKVTNEAPADLPEHDQNTSNSSSVLLETAEASTTETNPSQKSSKINDSKATNDEAPIDVDANQSSPEAEVSNETPLVDANEEPKGSIDASRQSVAGSKSVTFAEVAAQDTSAKSDDVFHDTCTDFADNDVSDEQPDPTHKIHAGATPSRTRFNLSLRSSTPLGPSASASNASAVDSSLRIRGRLPLKRASVHTDVPVEQEKPTEPLSRSWSQAVHGTSASQIDKSAQDVSTEEVIKRPVPKAQLDDFIDDDEKEAEDSNNSKEEEAHNSFVDNEAEEVDEYDEHDSMDSSTKEYLRANEVPTDGHSIGSKDSEHGDGEEEDEDEMDSFIVSDNDEEDDLLDGTGDDLSADDEAKVAKPRRSVLRLADSSEDEDNEVAVETVSDPAEKDNEINDDSTLISNEVGDEESINDKTNNSIQVSERQSNKLLSKTISEISDKKAASKLNKSLGTSASKAEIDFSVYVEKIKSKTNSEQSPAANLSIQVPERQISKLLSNSVSEEGTQKKKKSKHNKSLGTAMDTENGDISFSAYVAEKKQKKSKTLPEPKNVSASTETVQDVEMQSPPKVKTLKVKAQKAAPPSYDDIMSRCQSLLQQASEARRNDRQQNKKEVPEDVVERIKSKREQKQLEKARRAANLLKLQQDEAERIKRKAEKKLLKKSKVSEPNQEISKAIAHGIELLTKSKRLPETHVLPTPAVPVPVVAQTSVDDKKKKNKRVAQPVNEIQPEISLPESKKAKKNQNPINLTIEQLDDIENVRNVKKQKKTISSTAVESFIDQQPTSKKQKKITSAFESYVDHQPDIISKKSKKSKKIDNPIEQNGKIPDEAQPLHKKAKRLLESDDSIVQSLPKKLKVSKVEKKRLNILAQNSSPEYEPEPTKKSTKKQPTEYNVLQVRSVAAQEKTVQRKRKQVAPPSPVKPQWTSAGEFLVSKLPFAQSENVLHVHHKSYGTDFVVTSLNKKRKIKATASDTFAAPAPVLAQVAEYRAKVTNGDRVKRETTEQMLQHKKKMHAYTRF